MNNEIEFKFGDYAIIEQKRHGVSNEMFVHKVIGQLRSNSWVDVPVQSPATETLHDEMEDVCWCICCGVDETKVRKYRVKDMQRSNLSPDGGEVTALALTIEKSKEASGCPDGVDLQDWVKMLVSELSVVEEIHNSAVFITDELYDASPKEVQGIIRSLACMKMPAYARLVAGIKADGVEMAAKSDQFSTWVQQGLRSFAIGIRQGDDLSEQLREGADK